MTDENLENLPVYEPGLDQVVAEIVSNDNYAVARANGSTVHFDGFYKVYKESKDDEEEESDGGLEVPEALEHSRDLNEGRDGEDRARRVDDPDELVAREFSEEGRVHIRRYGIRERKLVFENARLLRSFV